MLTDWGNAPMVSARRDPVEEIDELVDDLVNGEIERTLGPSECDLGEGACEGVGA